MPPTPAPASGAPARATSGSALTRAAGLIGWVAVLVAVIVGFTALGSGPLAAPALTEPSAWSAWAEGREPVLMAFAVLRLAVLAIAWYLLGVTVIGAAARLLRWGRLVTIADLLTVPSVRRLLQASLGLGLATAALTAAPVADLTPAEPTVATVQLAMQRDGAQALGGSSAVMAPLVEEGSTAVMRVADEEEAALPATWEIASGEHLWSIAEQVLATAWQRPASDVEITPYWAQLIEANRDGLPDPGNPDLVYPGQVVTIPTPPPAP
jgi:nucleoid-associated protein YgaU